VRTNLSLLLESPFFQLCQSAAQGKKCRPSVCLCFGELHLCLDLIKLGVFVAELLDLWQRAWPNRGKPINPRKTQRTNDLKQSSLQLDALPDQNNLKILDNAEAKRVRTLVKLQKRSWADLVLVSELAWPVQTNQKFRRQLWLQTWLLLRADLWIIYTLIVINSWQLTL